jgi:chromosome segregation ATPase
MIRFTTLAFLTFVFTSGAATAQISPPADPFEKYFDRIEERLAAQTAVMERIGAVLERVLDQGRAAQQERDRLEVQVRVEEMRVQLLAQAAALRSLQDEQQRLLAKTADLLADQQLFEAEIGTLRAELQSEREQSAALRAQIKRIEAERVAEREQREKAAKKSGTDPGGAR